jgi:parvulin-like peptidyl-prolyl isomerase
VAAVINGHSVPIAMYRLLVTLDHRSSPTQPLATIEKSVMQEIIYDELIRQYAVAHGITVSPAELAAREQQDASSSGGEQAFQRLLSQRYGLTIAQYRAIVAPNLLAQKVEQHVAPVKGLLTDAQARALAERLLNELHHGADFAALAKKYSGDPGSAAQGGDLGKVTPGQTVPPFDQAAFHAPLKTYVLVHSVYGYHIVEVLSRGKAAPTGRPNGAKVLSAHVRHILISTQASQPQQQQQQQAFLAWLKQQQKQATIKWLARTQSR